MASKRKRMDRRDVVRLATKHILAQGCFAIHKDENDEEKCDYINSDGYMCAIGGLPGVQEVIANFEHQDKAAKVLLQDCPGFRDLFTSDVDGMFLNLVQSKLHDELSHAPYDAKAVRRAARMVRETYC